MLKKNNLDPLDVNLAYINSKNNLNYYVFGIEKISQIKKIINARDKIVEESIFKKIRGFFLKNDIDPRKW